MPLYEYSCPTCKAQFERLRSMDQGETAGCPDCGTSSVRTLSLFAAPARSTAFAGGPAMGGGAAACCGGGGCACHPA